MGHYPQIIATSIHRLSTRVIQNLWTAMWTNRWRTVENQGTDRWTTWENSGDSPHTPPRVHTERTPPVHKKWAANWENVVLPRIHSPYYYYVLITQ